jgi:hypothetical protein
LQKDDLVYAGHMLDMARKAICAPWACSESEPRASASGPFYPLAYP